MAAGKNAVKQGSALEKQVCAALEGFDFTILGWAGWKKNGSNVGRFLVKQWRYEALSGHPDSRADWAVIEDGKVVAIIEVKNQNTAGSTSAKLIYAALDARHHTASSLAIVVTGGAMIGQEQGDKRRTAEEYHEDLATRIIDKEMALCYEGDDGEWIPFRKTTLAMRFTIQHFNKWAYERFHVKQKMVNEKKVAMMALAA